MADARSKRPLCRGAFVGIRGSAVAHLLWTGGLLAVAIGVAKVLGLPLGFAIGTLALYALLTAYVTLRVGDHAPNDRFGIANRLTLFRGALACLLGGLVVVAHQAGPQLLWTAAGAGLAALALDGLDGLVARRRGEASRFGAAFDLETDALLILLLSLLMYRLDRGGAWVMAIGLLRYAFVAAGQLWVRLTAPLPESRRRKAVCAAQVAIMVACIPPALPAVATETALATSLAGLIFSFALDVAWLTRRADPARQ